MTSYTDTACSICRQRDRQTDRHDDYRRTDRQTDRVHVQCARQWRTSGGATPWRAGSNDLAGRSTALAQALAPPWLKPCVLLCFSNRVKKCYHIWPLYLFYFDCETALAACVLRATTKKGRQLFWGKSASGWPGWRFFWHTPLLRWRRHCDGHIPLPRK